MTRPIEIKSENVRPARMRPTLPPLSQLFRQMLCLWLPWHRFIVRKRMSAQTDYLRCSCGREYGINHDARVILPWDAAQVGYGEVNDDCSGSGNNV